MLGFDIDKSLEAIYESIKDYKKIARAELLNTFNSAGYKEIFKNVTIDKNFEFFNFDLQDGVKIGKQDLIQVLAQGGAIKKNDEFIMIKPSKIISKYLGKR